MAPRQKTRVIVAQETTGVLVRRMNVMTAWQNKRAKGQDSHYRASNYGGATKPIIGASSVRRNPHQFSLPNNEPVSRITTRINSNPIYHGTLGLQYRHSNLICSYGARSQLAGAKTRQLCYRNSDTRS